MGQVLAVAAKFERRRGEGLRCCIKSRMDQLKYCLSLRSYLEDHSAACSLAIVEVAAKIGSAVQVPGRSMVTPPSGPEPYVPRKLLKMWSTVSLLDWSNLKATPQA